MITNKTIGEVVRKLERDYIRGNTIISKYVTFNMWDTIEKIEAYLNSKHISGSYDSKGRKKPFFNVVTSASNIWFRATDLDRKNVIIKPTKSHDTLEAILATIWVQDWMRKHNFGSFLNEWGRVLARYGSAVIKFVENSNGLNISVIPWNRLIVDPVEFDPNPKIEILEFTEAQLRESGYDEDKVNNLINAKKARETLDNRRKDNKSDYYKLYEVHGKFPVSMLKESQGKGATEADKKKYTDQMYVYSYVGGNGEKDIQDFILYSGEEEKCPYMITHLIKEDGRTLAIGAVEHLFENQWMQNHTAKAIKDQLDLASKLMFQTSDGQFLGENVLDAIENGDIMVHKVNEPITQVNNGSHDITQWQNFATTWKALGNEITGISESMLGQNPPSGTAWRQTEALLQESHSLFELMTENKGLHVEEMLRNFILPYLKKKTNNTDEIVATLSDYGMDKIETMYIKSEAIRRVKDNIKQALLTGTMPKNLDIIQQQNDIKQELIDSGNMRFLKPSEISDKTWKQIFKDLEWDVEINITGELKNSDAVMTTLNTLLTTLVRLNGQPMSPEVKFVFKKILTETSAITPIEFDSITSNPAPQPQMNQPIQPNPQTLSNNQPVMANAGGALNQ